MFDALLRDLQFHSLDLGAMVHEAPFDHRALLNFDAFVMYVPFDTRTGLEFERFARIHRPVDRAVHHHMGGLDLAVDARLFRDYQRTGLVRQRRDVAAHRAVDPQASAEKDITFDARGGADQAVDTILRFALSAKHACLSFSSASRFASLSVPPRRPRKRVPARSPPWPWGSPGTCRRSAGSA